MGRHPAREPPPPLGFAWIGVRARATQDALARRDAQASASELEALSRDAGQLADLIRRRIAKGGAERIKLAADLLPDDDDLELLAQRALD